MGRADFFRHLAHAQRHLRSRKVSARLHVVALSTMRGGGSAAVGGSWFVRRACRRTWTCMLASARAFCGVDCAGVSILPLTRTRIFTWVRMLACFCFTRSAQPSHTSLLMLFSHHFGVLLLFPHTRNPTLFLHKLSLMLFLHTLSLMLFPHKLSLMLFPHKLSLMLFPHKLSLMLFPHKLSLLLFPHKLSLLLFPHKLSLILFPHKLSLMLFPRKLSLLLFSHSVCRFLFSHKLPLLLFSQCASVAFHTSTRC